MNHYIVFAALALCGLNASCHKVEAATVSQQDTIVWMTDFAAAKAQAAAESKPLFLSFSGSDWCGWCKRLDKEVLSTPEFQKALSQKMIFVQVDFPKKPLPDALKAQNDALMKEYKVRGFPTIIVLDANGNKLGTLGYKEGGPVPFIQKVQELINAGSR